MLLSYVHRTGQEVVPDLCLLADKPDEYSVPVSVDSLPITSSAVVRLGPNEAVVVKSDAEGEKVISPIKPSLLFLTPSQPDMPGVKVSKVKIVKKEVGLHEVFFQQDKDITTGEWRNWNPNDVQR